MPETENEESPRNVTVRETLTVVLGLVALAAVQLCLTASFSLFDRYLWLDEIHTHLLVTDPELTHAAAALAGGADFNPPGLYLMLRGLDVFTGGGPISWRAAAVGSVLAALLGIYLLVRHAAGRAAAAIAVIVVWSHPLVVFQAFEARFYAPWLAAVVWLAYSLARYSREEAGPFWRIAVAACSVAVCLIHYFGVISLVLVTAAHLAFNWRSTRDPLRLLAALSAGPAALLACIPLYLGQRGSLTVPTWMPDPTWQSTLGFLHGLFLFPILALMIVAAGRYFSSGAEFPPESMPLPARKHTNPKRKRGRQVLSSLALRVGVRCVKLDGERYISGRLRPLAGLTGLLALPAVLIALSYAAQPAMMGRYALPAIAAVAPVAALMARGIDRPRWSVVCVVLLLLGSCNLAGVRQYMQTRDADWDQLAAWLASDHPHVPVLFELRDDLYPMCQIAPSLAGEFYFHDFPDAAPGWQTRRFTVERDVARNHHRLYGWPQLLTPDDLNRLGRIYYVASRPDPARVTQQFPGFNVRRVRDNVFELSALEPSESVARLAIPPYASGGRELADSSSR